MPLSVKHVYVNLYTFSKTVPLSRRPACEIVELYWGAMSKEILIQYKIFIEKMCILTKLGLVFGVTYTKMSLFRRRGLGSSPGQVMWIYDGTKWGENKCFSEYLDFPLSV
jgi:hypothetical protein